MYIVGHFVTAKKAGLFEKGIGNNLTYLMIPDYTSSHQWGYNYSFRLDPICPIMRYFKAHMLGDWFVHFGSYYEQKKRGWAYRNMKIFAGKYEDFFSEAKGKGILKNHIGTQESIRGFSHTMMEYLIDYYLSSLKTNQDLLQYSKKYLGEELFQPLGWLQKFLDREEVTCNLSILESAQCFGSRVLMSKRLEEFVLRAGIKKFGLISCDESLEFMEHYLKLTLNEFSIEKIEQLIADAAIFIKDHLKLPEMTKGVNKWI